MSVVNKMLQDLEQRQQHNTGFSSDYQAPAKNSNRTLLIAVLSIFVLAGALWWATSAGLFAPLSENSNGPAPTVAADPSVPHKQKPQVKQPISTQASQAAPQRNQITERDQAANHRAADDQIPERESVQTTDSAPAEPQQQIEPANVTPSMTVSSSNPLHIRDPRAEAQFALQQGDTKAAIHALFDLIEVEPDNLNARKKLASLLFAEGNQSSAEKLLQEGIAAHPKDADIRLMLARLYVRQQQSDVALKILEPVQVYAINNAEFISYRAALAKELNRHNIAYQDYLQLAKAEPEQARWWLGFAVAAERIQETPSAIAAYERALSLQQLSAEVVEFMRQRLRYLRAQS